MNVEVANSSHVEALFEGVLVDESAADSVPAGVPMKPRSAEETVNAYRDYSDDQLRDPAHDVTLDMLLAIVSDAQAAKVVRERAAATIAMDRVIVTEPELSMEGRRQMRPRAVVSMKVSALLSDGDPFRRQLAKQILEELWVGWKQRVFEIKFCDPLDKDSCEKARLAWERVFRS